MSRRGALAGLVALMGVPSVASLEEIKPSDSRWDGVDLPSLGLKDSDGETLKSISDLLAMVRQVTLTSFDEEDLSDCIHTINSNRMTDLGGCTVMMPGKTAGDENKPRCTTRPS
jgi:hypothetical protein